MNITGSELQKTLQIVVKEHMENALKEKPEIAEKRTFTCSPLF